MPGVVYGPEKASVTISVGSSDLLRLYRKAGKSSLIDLDVGGDMIKVLIQDIQFHPVRSDIIHIDFFAVNLKKVTTVDVPLNFIGESPAVKNLGCMLTRDHEYISIRCLPTDIPHDIAVDISKLENLQDSITIADLDLDIEKYELMHLTPEVVLCSVVGAIMAEDPEASDSVEGVAGDEAKSEGKQESSKSE